MDMTQLIKDAISSGDYSGLQLRDGREVLFIARGTIAHESRRLLTVTRRSDGAIFTIAHYEDGRFYEAKNNSIDIIARAPVQKELDVSKPCEFVYNGSTSPAIYVGKLNGKRNFPHLFKPDGGECICYDNYGDPEMSCYTNVRNVAPPEPAKERYVTLHRKDPDEEMVCGPFPSRRSVHENLRTTSSYLGTFKLVPVEPT